MMDFASLPTVEEANLEKYYDVIRQLDPELYMIKIALEETKINPLVLPKVIRQLSNLAMGTGYGKVQIFMARGTITQIKGEESDEFNDEAVTK